jgi:adenine-specific DNA-methyltransferase
MFLSEADDAVIPTTLWASGDEYGFNQDGIRELRQMSIEFPTPKPERLIQRILHIATNPGDLVLDSFLGSGTTAAVAHKMGRRYIGIEMGEHARTHCLPRLEKVIDGEQGGISKAVNWQGGGGFRFHTVGDPVFDADGSIHPAVRFAALAGYLWHFETGEPARQVFDSPLLGVHQGTAYYLLYNGILGDRRPAGGNVLTAKVLAHLDALFPHAGPRVIYGETTWQGEARLREAGITFKQIPYDIKAR